MKISRPTLLEPHELRNQQHEIKAGLVTVRSIPSSAFTLEEQRRPKPWTPISLRTPYLLALALITLGLIILLQLLLLRSQRNSGLLFAPNISELSAFQSSLYLYLPTTIAVVFSLAWSWIAHDAMRIEPYRQLSKPGGAIAEDSVLLHYTSDFISTVPIKSFRRRHWAVFVTSTATILLTWGITPLQAAIFAVDTITKSHEEPMAVSRAYLTIDEQKSRMTANYTYSVSNIAWFGARMPPYMSRNAALAPFEPSEMPNERDTETWTATTTMYSMDLACELPALRNVTWHIDTNNPIGENFTAPKHTNYGCRVDPGYVPIGQIAMVGTAKEYAAFYAGNDQGTGNEDDWAIGGMCPLNSSHVFLIAFGRNKLHDNDTVQPPTTLFCNPTYYQQEVDATVKRSDRGIVNIAPTGSKDQIPLDMYDSNNMDYQMTSSFQRDRVRGDIPSTYWPDQAGRIATYPIGPFDSTSMTEMIGLAIGAYPRAASDYMNASVLAQSYEAAYRLVFARAMIDILRTDFDHAVAVNGTRLYTTQVVYMIPAFTYAVEGLLTSLLILTIILLPIHRRPPLRLSEDPGPIRALMELVANDEILLRTFSSFGVAQEQSIARLLARQRFFLKECETGYELRQIPDGPLPKDSNPPSEGSRPLRRKETLARTPWQLRTIAGIVFAGILIALGVVLAYLYNISLLYGLPLPSQGNFVRQLVENFIPTAFATLIEPTWVMINRLLCMVQPIHELRKGHVAGDKSIGLNYTSLPPQLVILRACFNKHLGLATVCTMALLSSLLAVAFSGMFNEAPVLVPVPAEFKAVYQPAFKEFDPTMSTSTPGPDTGKGLDQFYIGMTNVTSFTPLPPWTDASNFYLPVILPAAINYTDLYRVETRAFGVDVRCSELLDSPQRDWSIEVAFNQTLNATEGKLRVSIDEPGFGTFHCAVRSSYESIRLKGSCPPDSRAMEFIRSMHASDAGNTAQEGVCERLLVSGWFRSSHREPCTGGDNTADTYTVNATNTDARMLVCIPALTSQRVNVTVDRNGEVQSMSSTAAIETEVQSYFLGNPFNAILQANNFLVAGAGVDNSWHDDSFPSDWNTYLMEHLAGTNDFLNPALPPPAFDEVAPLLADTYRMLFAIWIGIRQRDILLPANQTSEASAGSIIQRQTRVIVSRPMLIVAESILAAYVLTLLGIYGMGCRNARSGLPNTMAAMIATFAASVAVRDFGHNSNLSDEQRSAFKYGLGAFKSRDGRSHVGIERDPFVLMASHTNTSATGYVLRWRGRGRHSSSSSALALDDKVDHYCLGASS